MTEWGGVSVGALILGAVIGGRIHCRGIRRRSRDIQDRVLRELPFRDLPV